jgi:hypothetical protein
LLAAVSAHAEREPRYLAELHIDDYAGPELFRRLNALHSEWAAGRVKGRLIVYDLTTRAPICQTPISVRGDASGAPIRRRLREATRASLEAKLLDGVRAEMNVALGGISGVLKLEERESEGGATLLRGRAARAPGERELPKSGRKGGATRTVAK